MLGACASEAEDPAAEGEPLQAQAADDVLAEPPQPQVVEEAAPVEAEETEAEEVETEPSIGHGVGYGPGWGYGGGGWGGGGW